MLARALDAGVPAAWVTADEVYGADPGLRAELERRGTGYVLAIACHRRLTTGGVTIRADDLAARLPARAWQQLSAGAGAKGPRYHDWAWADLDGRACRWLLVRRHPGTGKPAFYLCWAPRAVTLATLVRVAGSRWAIEESFRAAKGQVGLDHYQVRGWEPWHRFTTLAMLALAFLAVTAATTCPAPDPDHPGSPHTCALSMAEIRHLLRPLLTGSAGSPPPCWPGPPGDGDPKPAPAAPTTSEDTSSVPPPSRPLLSFHAPVNGLRAGTPAARVSADGHRHDRQPADTGMRQDDRHGQYQAPQARCCYGTRPHGPHDQGHPRRVTAADLAPPAGPLRHHPARPA